MTLPEQSDRAVAQTREFLVRLASPYVEGGIKGIRREVRAEALALLRHYPYSYRESDEKRGNGDMSGAWIPVSERWPERNEIVLAVDEGGVTVGSYSPMLEDWWSLHGDRMAPGPTVSHWMPLPEPPEETP
jgi:hypothetical protein